jgi:aminoglycoside phosphotransferase (APT) family kinase protein
MMGVASIMLPAALADRVELVLGERVRTAEAAIGGHSNLVFTINDVVVKAASVEVKRQDVSREIELLRRLDGLGCASPSLIGAHIDDEWVVMATIKSAGLPGTTVLQEVQNNPAYAATFGTLMGRMLRNVHGVAPRPIAGELYERTGLLADAAFRLRLLDISEAVQATLHEAIEHPVHRRGVAFLHGDPGLHNVLIEIQPSNATELRIAALVDWELGGWGNALTDLSWLYWTMWFRGIHETAWPAFVAGYGAWAVRALGWSKESVTACILGQMAVLLVRTDSGTAVRDIWLDRIAKLHRIQIPEVSEITA